MEVSGRRTSQEERAILLLLYTAKTQAATILGALHSNRCSVVACPVDSGVGFQGFLQQLEPDIILLEPPNDKRQIVQMSETVRSLTDRPIVVLSSQSDELVVTRAFAAGIDEYLQMPIGARELGARLDAMLRRVQRTMPQHEEPGIEGLVLSASDLSVTCRGTKIILSPIEFRLLSCLASAAGQVVTHDALMLRVWGPEYVDSRHYLHLYVRYLREKLEEDPSNAKIILSEWGVGYRLQAPGI